MRNLAFSLHQVKQAIRVQGSEYQVMRDIRNEFGEPDGGSTLVVTLKGLWHTSNSYVTLNGQEGSTVRSKRTPMVLCLLQDSTGIEQGDFIMVGTTRYNVNGVDDVGNLGIVAEVSLEAVV